ncbi:DUF2384 domain-containing protein [Mucilaginibacter corticis]|uniref:DUF2384 domain-containing protein n=1 Tax=Mucilaginibacter corticis TaxID=2597670 RepID=A0A556M9K7_9SPHI|nr:antitoxin Xre/MbcA/ParS toxin-binding domain-containing protein [Mucilaginibacter corticis]TSJ36590.1 DUF2384 domain-containing protein [Mucilaginibacter corticis]
MKTLDIRSLTEGVDEYSRAYWYFLPDDHQKNENRCKTRLDVLDCIRHGVPYDAIEIILDRTSVSRKVLAQILHLSVRQMNRYDKNDLLPVEQSGFIYEFSRLYIRGLDIFGDVETLENWLNRPQLALGNQVPLELLDTAEGYRLVHDVLAQIEFGFYA